MHSLIESNHITAEEKELLSIHLQNAESVKTLEPSILVAKCRKCFDAKKMRLTLCVHHSVENILTVVTKALQGQGAVLKRGVAPRSGNEREIQSMLDALSEM